MRNRTIRRIERAHLKRMVRQIHPAARFLSAAALRKRDPAKADDFEDAVTGLGFTMADVVLFESRGSISMMVPPNEPQEHYDLTRQSSREAACACCGEPRDLLEATQNQNHFKALGPTTHLH